MHHGIVDTDVKKTAFVNIHYLSTDKWLWSSYFFQYPYLSIIKMHSNEISMEERINILLINLQELTTCIRIDV